MLCKAGPRGRAIGWATLGVYLLSWLLSNNRLQEVCGTLTTCTFSNQLLLSNQDKGCTPSVAHLLALPLGPALHNLTNSITIGILLPFCMAFHRYPRMVWPNNLYMYIIYLHLVVYLYHVDSWTLLSLSSSTSSLSVSFDPIILRSNWQRRALSIGGWGLILHARPSCLLLYFA